jgi:predicted DsbA family dithiol-disulfide isomerase
VSIEALKQEFDLQIRFIHFPLHPETPAEGLEMRALFANRNPDDMKAMGDHIRQLMEASGLPYGKRTMTYNSRLAQEFAAWAEAETDQVDAVHDALFKAYFVDNRNIGAVNILKEIAEDLGLDTARATEALNHRLYSPQVNADWQRAWENGVTGVPTFTAKELYVYGHQPPEILGRFIRHLQTQSEV